MSDSITSSSDGPALLLVAAKSLQSYVLGSDKLREMVGATQLIEDFCSRDKAAAVLAAMGISNGKVLTGAAGQTTIHFESIESAHRAAALWPWIASRMAPGLEVHVGLAPLSFGYKKAMDECQNQIGLSRNRPTANLPSAAPPHLRNPRSGLVATQIDDEDPDREINNNKPIPVDETAWVKRQRRKAFREGSAAAGSMFATFSLDKETTPDSFEDITKGGPQGDRTYLAIVHADGNGFGKMLMDIGRAVEKWNAEKSVELFQDLSKAIREIGEQAANNAIETTEKALPANCVGKKPWLPIVQAGDDLTLVIRADLAFDFLVEYLKQFESLSKAQLASLHEKHTDVALPEKLTAGGAIVYCKTQHPFAQAYALCESITGSRAKGERVKDDNGDARSALAFHRITASTSPIDINEIAENELRCTDGQEPVLGLGCQTWFLNAEDDPFTVKNLMALRDALAQYPSGSRRQILSDLRTNRNEAVARLARMMKIGAEAGHGDSERAIKKDGIENALAAVHSDSDKPWLEPSGEGKPARSAIPDAMVLLEATRTSTSH